MMPLIGNNSMTIDNLVPRRRDNPCALLDTRPTEHLHCLVDSSGHIENPRALDERRELDNCGDTVTRSPSLVRDHDGVHELLRPGVFDLERLLVLERLRRESAEERHGGDGLEVVGEAGADGGSVEFVGDGGAAKDGGVHGAGERPADLDLEGEEVAAGLEGVGVALGVLEEGPLVVADAVGDGAVVEGEPGAG